jgi:hypothetical protein
MAKRKIPDLIVEPVADEGNLHVLSLLEHRRQCYLVVVDNIGAEQLGAYVLDYAQQEGLDLAAFISLVEEWLAGGGGHPLSFELSRRGLTAATRRIYKTFDLAHVSRLVGRPFSFELTEPERVRRRRAQTVPAGVEVRPVATVSRLAPRSAEGGQVAHHLEQDDVGRAPQAVVDLGQG